jgi:hypothetical protein
MNRTVHDLVDALRADEQGSFDTDAVWQGSLRRARKHAVQRRTAIALAAGVAAVVAVVTPAMVLSAGSPGPDPVLPGHSSSPTASGSTVATPTPNTPPPSTPPVIRPAFSETLREVSDGGWHILPTETSAHHQRANVLGDGDSVLVAAVDVYEPGVFDPSPVLGGTRTTVDTAPAYFAWVLDPSDMNGNPRPTLAWERAPDTWVVARLEPDGSPPSMSMEIPRELADIASLVEIGDPVPIRLPFRLGHRPENLVPHSVTHFSAVYPDRTVYYEYTDEPVDFWDPDRNLRFPLQIYMRPAAPDQWQPNTTVGGRPAMRTGNNLTVAIDDVWVTLAAGVVSPLATEEMEQIFTGLTFADWNDQSTWFDANTAA